MFHPHKQPTKETTDQGRSHRVPNKCFLFRKVPQNRLGGHLESGNTPGVYQCHAHNLHTRSMRPVVGPASQKCLKIKRNTTHHPPWKRRPRPEPPIRRGKRCPRYVPLGV
ncbi:unnamed protein product [Ectocarpus sp. 13 AM-2016]